jgi:hypothetical protein
MSLALPSCFANVSKLFLPGALVLLCAFETLTKTLKRLTHMILQMYVAMPSGFDRACLSFATLAAMHDFHLPSIVATSVYPHSTGLAKCTEHEFKAHMILAGAMIVAVRIICGGSAAGN